MTSRVASGLPDPPFPCIYVKDMQAVVEDDRIVKFRINAKISFLLERDD